MTQIAENVRQVLVQLVPAAVLNNISCFVFYDNHPRDKKQIDITVCTETGEVKEYFQRELICSLKLNFVKPTEIKILRNNVCDLFYLISTDDHLCILARKKKLEVLHELSNVERFEVSDICCSGKASLKVIRKDDAVPITFDNNFESFLRPDISQTFTEQDDDALPIINHLKRKLTEARYSVKCNQKSYNELLNLRQAAAYSMYKSVHPNLDDSALKGGYEEMCKVVKLNSGAPWVKMCNKKIAIIQTVCNQNEYPLQDVTILLHGLPNPSITYTTKLFVKTNSAPFWKATKALESNKETVLVSVLEVNEMKNNVLSRIEFKGVIFYKDNLSERYLPFKTVCMSTLDTLGAEFDALSCEKFDKNTLLAILATTEQSDLILKHVQNDTNTALGMDMFCKYMDMEQVNASTVVHRKSPYHILNGTMVTANEDGEDTNGCWRISVHSRTPSQVLALVHLIYDAVPITIVATTPNYTISPKSCPLKPELISEGEKIIPLNNLLGYGSSILDRSTVILDYLNSSMIKMYESKNPVVQGKVGKEIDLFVNGSEAFKEFRCKMMEKASEGVQALMDTAHDDNAMVLD